MQANPGFSGDRAVVWKFILDRRGAGFPVVLLYVLESSGSSPGRRGFHMAVSADGSFSGTIGGGVMEHKFVEMAKSLFARPAPGESVFRQVHDKSASQQSGMICSGEQTIFVYPLTEADLHPIRNMVLSMDRFENGTMVLTPGGISFSDEVPGKDFEFTGSGTDFVLKEKTGLKNIIHVIGGGHCSLALCRILRDLDFFINVYDDRTGLSTMDRNAFAHRMFQLHDYSELSGHIRGGSNEYAVIMTFGYRTDDISYRAIMEKPFKFIGMLGSRKKMEKLREDYRREGISENLLENLVAPVGLLINSETASEIAISIAAQLIAVKNIRQ